MKESHIQDQEWIILERKKNQIDPRITPQWIRVVVTTYPILTDKIGAPLIYNGGSLDLDYIVSGVCVMERNSYGLGYHNIQL